MIPGSISKLSESSVASASTITAKSDILYVAGVTGVNTIIPGLGTAQSQLVIFVPTESAIVLGTSGNILVGITAAQSRAVFMIWSKKYQKWIIENGV